MLVVIVLGGIYGGVFTPPRRPASAAVYAFVITVFVYRDLKLADVQKMLLNAANMSAMLLYIIANAVLFSFLLTHENIPQAMAAWSRSISTSGRCGEHRAARRRQRDGSIVDPADHAHLGIDLVQLGILMAVNIEVGLCHPPVGLNLYVASGIAGRGITELTVAVPGAHAPPEPAIVRRAPIRVIPASRISGAGAACAVRSRRQARAPNRCARPPRRSPVHQASGAPTRR
jgi:C4-dicarboxylate transporter, DctM subunit